MNRFIVSRIEGEYAYLLEENSGEELFIAMALLPPDINIGTKLVNEGLEFRIER